MKNNKLSRQNVFDTVWEHFIVKGNPYSISLLNNDYPYASYFGHDGNRSPAALFYTGSTSENLKTESFKTFYNKIKNKFNKHVDYNFLAALESAHSKTLDFIFEGTNVNLIRNFYARRFRREFRKTLKYYLINTAFQYGLTIPSELPRTPAAKRMAYINKD